MDSQFRYHYCPYCQKTHKYDLTNLPPVPKSLEGQLKALDFEFVYVVCECSQSYAIPRDQMWTSENEALHKNLQLLSQKLVQAEQEPEIIYSGQANSLLFDFVKEVEEAIEWLNQKEYSQCKTNLIQLIKQLENKTGKDYSESVSVGHIGLEEEIKDEKENSRQSAQHKKE